MKDVLLMRPSLLVIIHLKTSTITNLVIKYVLYFNSNVSFSLIRRKEILYFIQSFTSVPTPS